jgi:hypothetical protein
MLAVSSALAGKEASAGKPAQQISGLNDKEATRGVAVFLIDPSTQPTASLRMTRGGGNMQSFSWAQDRCRTRKVEVGNAGKEGEYPVNPNGSVDSIAGLTDGTGRVMGLMPHPERYVRRTQHPHWTRLKDRADGDGMTIFNNAVAYVKQNFSLEERSQCAQPAK